jgi:hypothetical protein
VVLPGHFESGTISTPVETTQIAPTEFQQWTVSSHDIA